MPADPLLIGMPQRGRRGEKSGECMISRDFLVVWSFGGEEVLMISWMSQIGETTYSYHPDSERVMLSRPDRSEVVIPLREFRIIVEYFIDDEEKCKDWKPDAS